MSLRDTLNGAREEIAQQRAAAKRLAKSLAAREADPESGQARAAKDE